MNGRELLNNAGEITHQMAKERAEIEFNKYNEKLEEIKFEQNIKELEQDIKKLNPKKVKEK